MSARARHTTSSAPPVAHIGPYKLGRVVGQGVFAKVRLGEDEFGRKYAIKEFDKKKISPHHLQQIERELNVLRVLNHPHIAQFVEVLETHSNIFLVMEYISGGELYEYVHKTGKLPERDSARLFYQICAAVRHCHRTNVVHRDLKPENILLTEPDPDFVAAQDEKDRDGLLGRRAKVVDLGLANFTGKNKFGEPITEKEMNEIMRTQCGSPHYACPEILQGKPYYGRPCDIWSLGIILYALLCARLPFHAPDFPALRTKICSGRYQFPPHMSQEAKDLVSSMLKIKPEERVTIDQIMENKWLLGHGPHGVISLPASLPSFSTPTDGGTDSGERVSVVEKPEPTPPPRSLPASATIQKEARCTKCKKALNLRRSETGYMVLAASSSILNGTKTVFEELCTCDDDKVSITEEKDDEDNEVDGETAQEEFFRAVETGNVRRLRELLTFSADHPDQLKLDHRVTPKKWTALHYAAVMGHTAVIEALLPSMQKVDINARDYKGRTPLMLAAGENKIESVSVLLECGADVNLRDNQSQTAIFVAIRRKNTEISELLTQASSERNRKDATQNLESTFRKQLRDVCEKGDESALKLILSQHFPLSTPSSPSMSVPSSPVPSSPLTPPSPLLPSPLLSSPITAPASPISSKSSSSSSSTSSSSGSLTSSPAPSRRKSEDKKGAITLGITGMDNWTALHYAARHGHAGITRLLLTYVKDAQKMLPIDSLSSTGWTPLMIASFKGNAKVVQVLLELKANTTVKNKEGKTAAELARESNHKDIMTMLDRATKS